MLVSGCDISMLVKDDRPDRWNAKTGNFKILIYKCCWMHLINFVQLYMERVFILSEWSHLTHGGRPKKHQCCHRSSWEKCQTNGHKLCDMDILFSAGLMGHSVLICNMRPQNLRFKLCLSILITEKIKKKYCHRTRKRNMFHVQLLFAYLLI